MPIQSRIVVQPDRDGPLQIQEVELPAPAPHEVLVKIRSSGVCQSQVFWMHQPRSNPVLFGHEGYGVVEATGEAVTGVERGDHVLVTWLPRKDPDGRAPVTSTVKLADGRTGVSPNVYTWAEYTLADELYVYPLPSEARLDEVAVVGCAVLTGAGSVLHSGVPLRGATAAVIGVGGVGLSAIAAAKALGAARVFALDLVEEKLRFARAFGATDCVDAGDGDPALLVAEGTGGGVDLVVDCVASESSVGQALRMARQGRLGERPGGVVCLVGIPKKAMSIDAPAMLFGQKSLVGSLAGGCSQADIATFLHWHRDGTLDLERMVTDRYPFDRVTQAVDDLVAGRIRGRSILVLD
ncbi:zinc-binding dehydrogenase [Streptomyces hirsutus]|uniref:zinc-binding dehydrogenase n=1 Tax=Streptomyces hirsutus TaxID=35620 RepID=UPI0036542EA4